MATIRPSPTTTSHAATTMTTSAKSRIRQGERPSRDPNFWELRLYVAGQTAKSITAFANGLLLPNAIAGAISVRPQAAGTAAGIHGFMQMAVGAAAAQWVSHLLAGAATAKPMAWVLFLFAIACGASVVLIWRPARVS